MTNIRLIRGWLAVVLFVPQLVFALSLGPIEVDSALNQPLKAEIKLSNAFFDNVQVKLATIAEFAQFQLERPGYLSQLKFEYVGRASGEGSILITTTEALREPILEFLIEVTWSGGRLLRNYIIFLDPDTYPVMVQTDGREDPRASSEKASDGQEFYGPITEKEYLWHVVNAIKPDDTATVSQIMIAIVRLNPHAFLQQNINGLKSQSILRVPTLDDIKQISAAEALKQVQQHNVQWQKVTTKNNEPREQESDSKLRVIKVEETVETVTPQSEVFFTEISPASSTAPTSPTSPMLVETQLNNENLLVEPIAETFVNTNAQFIPEWPSNKMMSEVIWDTLVKTNLLVKTVQAENFALKNRIIILEEENKQQLDLIAQHTEQLEILRAKSVSDGVTEMKTLQIQVGTFEFDYPFTPLFWLVLVATVLALTSSVLVIYWRRQQSQIELQPQVIEESEQATEYSLDEIPADSLDDEFSEASVEDFAGEDVIATQLDLARVYIEMEGREQDAKKLLEEVVGRGDSQQQEVAQELLKKLGD